jgi:thiamine kinase-like enzyme
MNLEKKTVEAFLNHHKADFSFPIGELQQVEELGRGAFNINYLVTTEHKKLVFRFILWPHRLEVDSMMEYEYDVLRKLQASGITPSVYVKDDSRDLFPYPTIVEEYFPSPTKEKIAESSHERLLEISMRCVDVLKKVHNYDFPEKESLLRQEDFISLERFKYRLGYLEKRNPKIYLLFQDHWKVLGEYLDHCNSVLQGRTIIHGDPFLENFLITESGIKLIDWQAPLYADKTIDLALFTWDFGWVFYGQALTQDEKDKIIGHYYSGVVASPTGETNKINVVLPFLYLNMLLEIEYRFFLLQDQEYKTNISPGDKSFILDQRIGPARKLVVNIPELQKWLERAETLIIERSRD